MKVAIGSDERTHLTDVVIDDLRKRGYEVETIGPLAGQVAYWPDVAIEVGKRVASGTADEGILLCWTGTGVSIAANKIPGVRAALCWDAETARGAKKWDGANVLCMSLRYTSEIVAKEILDAWLNTREIDPTEVANIEKVKSLDEHRRL
ncbi:MAG: RpiB/LacA/LacB family sugar-phosphate isomerase [Chloroflexi bacterium]|nr:RpiB/LacA/LacB family sugar-phosphate isomerase [Chloroflexota bacterium]